MSWKIDDIDFKTYGVGVIKSSGVLDMPKAYDKSTDWPDLDGNEYWQDAADVKYQDREIVLSCWIKASGYEEFKTKVQTFYTALVAPGERTLTTVYGNEIEHIIVQQAIQMVRKTAYVDSLQIGLFSLRLTVVGDPDFVSLNITRYYTTNIIATVLTRDLKINKTLQGDSYATFSFESNKKLDIRYFDEISLNTNGLAKDRFYFEAEPEWKELGSNKFTCNIKALHMQNWLSHSDFLDDLGQSDFAYYANFEEIIDLLLVNHQRDYSTPKFLKGAIDTTTRKLHKFSGENCLSVLRRLCADSEYNLEYEFEFDNSMLWQYKINVKKQVARDIDVVLEQGKGKGLIEITKGEMLVDELYTCLHAFGATTNIPAGYRNGMTRLSFDENPLKKNYGADYTAGQWGMRSKSKFYDDIYPHRTGTVETYYQVLPADLTDAQKYAHPEGIFKITDTTINFDVNDYLLNGLTAKVVMKSGDLAGMQFEINKYDHSTHEIYLIPFKDERGDLYPTGVLTIHANDTYTLIDIDLPEEYKTSAETELKETAQADLDEHCTPKYPYRCTVHPAWLRAQTQPFGFEVGDRAIFVSAALSLNGPLRISNLVYDAYKGTFDLTLSELVRTARLKKTDMRLDALERVVAAAGINKTEVTKKSQETTSELRNRILDPADDKLATDRIVRKESIDPFMLSLDASTPQISVSGGLVSTTETTVVIGAGVFYSNNFNAKTRREIIEL